MSSQSSEIRGLLDELKFRVSPEDIPAAGLAEICAFLKREREARSVYRLQRMLRACGMQKPQIRTFEQFEWKYNSGTPRDQIQTFRSSSWVSAAANLVLIGDPGIGKSHLAKAFCYDALQKGHTVFFATAFDLLSKIKRARSSAAKIEYYGRQVQVLCLDELGYTVYQKEDTDILFQVISKRCEALPTIVTTNLAPKQWGTIFSGPAASAILDRLSFNGTFLAWGGNSYRLAQKDK